MPTLKIPTPLRPYTDGQKDVTVSGSTVEAAMRNLVEQFPALEQHIFTEEGNLRTFIILFLGENNVSDMQGLETPMGKDDVLRIIPSIAGGHARIYKSVGAIL